MKKLPRPPTRLLRRLLFLWRAQKEAEIPKKKDRNFKSYEFSPEQILLPTLQEIHHLNQLVVHQPLQWPEKKKSLRAPLFLLFFKE